jgi:cytochrome c oxidase subunit 2
MLAASSGSVFSEGFDSMAALALNPLDKSSFWMPANGALHGFVLDRWMHWNLVAILVLFVSAQILLAFSSLRGHGNRPRRYFGLAGALPLALLCGMYLWMAIAAQRLWAASRFEGPSLTAMQVEVVGVQFQWYFRYPGVDATFGATKPSLVNAGAGNPLGIDPSHAEGNDDIVSSELVLPRGREVDLWLRAHDVIHGFFIPGMRLKQNALPGQILHVHFTPVAVGDYPILCTQVCGLGHGHMEARLRVLPPAEFDSWLAARQRVRLAQEAARAGGL